MDEAQLLYCSSQIHLKFNDQLYNVDKLTIDNRE